MSNTIKIGDKEIDIKQYRSDWALALMSQGIIVRLNISRWRATIPLKIEDLGLKFSGDESLSFMERYVNLGSEKLLPPEDITKMNTIETKARNCLKRYSFNTVWGDFVPYTAFEEWEKANLKIRDEFMAMGKDLSDRHDEIVQTVKKEYRKMAQDVWFRLYPGKGEATESFLENFVLRIVSQIPNRFDIMASFKYNFTYFIIPMPSLIEENISKAREIQRNREMQELEVGLEKNARRRVAEEYIKRKQELVDSFLEATVTSMRKYIAELCDSVLQSITANIDKKNINKWQKNRIKEMIRRIDLLNFHNDNEIVGLLHELEIEIDKFKGRVVKI